MATRNIVPRANGEGSIGTAVKHWGNGYFDELNTEKLVADDVIAKGPVVDVRAFGAVGDGVTDDTSAFLAALNSGGLYIPQNVKLKLNVSTPINIPDGTIITSDGGSIIIESSSAKIFSVDNSSLYVYNINIDVNYTGALTDYNNGIFAVTNSGKVVIKNTKITNNNITVLCASVAENIIIFQDNEVIGKNYNDVSGYCSVLFCFNRTDTTTITTKSNKINFENNTIWYGKHAIRLDCDDSLISGNKFLETFSPVSCFKVQNTIISNNVLRGFVSNGMTLGNGTDDIIENVTVVGNVLDGRNMNGEKVSTLHGINIYKQGWDGDSHGDNTPNYGLSKFINVNSNIIRYVNNSGIFAYVNGNININGNTCTYCGNGIAVEGHANLQTSKIGDLLIVSNLCAYNLNQGINSGITSGRVDNYLITANNAHNNGTVGIYCGGSNSGVIITNNNVHNNNEGIYINGNEDGVISENFIRNNIAKQVTLSLRTEKWILSNNQISGVTPLQYTNTIRPYVIKGNIGILNNEEYPTLKRNKSTSNTVSINLTPSSQGLGWVPKLYKVIVMACKASSYSDASQSYTEQYVLFSEYNGTARLVYNQPQVQIQNGNNITVNATVNNNIITISASASDNGTDFMTMTVEECYGVDSFPYIL